MKGQLFINGEWTGDYIETMDVFDPATGEKVGSIPKAGEKETKLAIDAAHDAFKDWSLLPAQDRASYLMKWHDLILENKDEIAEILTKEMGKPLAEAKGEIAYSASFIAWYAEEAKRIYGRTIPASAPNKRIQIMKQPVGVVASITPWNFPAAMIARKMAPALAAGCTFVAKPAELTPFTAIKLFELCEEAGFPKGVVNLVMGDAPSIGRVMTTSDKVRKLTFTGSTEVGKLLIQQSANKVHNLSLELGGHAPMIVCDDADLDLAVEGVIASKFRNAGQTCVCGNRIYVQEGILESFMKKLEVKVKGLKVGNGLEEGVDIGPLIEKKSYEKVQRHVEDAVAKGANVVIGGNGVANNDSYFFHPTILTNVTDDMVVMQEETFGPVAPIQTFKTDSEVVAKANDTRFGLAAYFFTENYSRGTKIAEGLEYGIVGWNDGVPAVAQAPFGGMKESGMGREGGMEGIEAFLETKFLSISLK
ncbi:NAD-dependent succinate-semialdehyde dehydrogenase [Evansella sp. AB-P1]|uniref:NAD-dependent succinate-semialdehyde dehydrogenase n=1 Tax=Evansella sp. AB-P1 TaxID=3037653 RepID=UPI00241C6BF1|nr:NAD-dependent succinate-semialdehyde dehydrogenase [Evansella sp. AB-P1]MDG5790013.1 NAD-dependent succinate-semialdehyde dehydrogenase [Evansella sp. AB-P1]